MRMIKNLKWLTDPKDGEEHLDFEIDFEEVLNVVSENLAEENDRKSINDSKMKAMEMQKHFASNPDKRTGYEQFRQIVAGRHLIPKNSKDGPIKEINDQNLLSNSSVSNGVNIAKPYSQNHAEIHVNNMEKSLIFNTDEMQECVRFWMCEKNPRTRANLLSEMASNLDEFICKVMNVSSGTELSRFVECLKILEDENTLKRTLISLSQYKMHALAKMFLSKDSLKSYNLLSEKYLI